MNITRRMIVIPVAAVMAVGIGAGAFAVGLTAARDVPEAVTQDTTFFVTMDGQQEFSAGGVAGAGDLDGSGDARITIDTATDAGVRRRHVHQRRPDLNLMHIHRGAAGVNGPIVVDFAPTPGAGTVQQSASRPPAPLTDEIAANPLGFYLNAHTTPFPAGAVQGSAAATAEFHPDPADTGSGVRLPAAELPRHPGARVELDHRRRPVAGRPLGSLPPGATAALVNITATDVRAAGFATVYSNALATAPATSTINWNGHDVAITTTVKVDSTGSVKVTIGPDGGTDLIIDVLGYLSWRHPGRDGSSLEAPPRV